jgi:hypothetical protein
VALKLTLIEAIEPENPDTFNVLVFTTLSLIGTAIVPDETVVGAVATDALSATFPPGHIAAEDGVTIGGDGETFTVNVAGFDISGNPPCEQVTTTLY